MPTTSTDHYGFPVRTCTRCGGSGQHSFNMIDGNVCYGCNGTGSQHPRGKVADAYIAFVEARRRHTQALVNRLAPGDVVTNWTDRPRADAVWRTVATITVDESQPCAWQIVDGVRSPSGYRTTVTYTDGTSETMSGNMVIRRQGTVDPAPFVAAATATRSRKVTA